MQQYTLLTALILAAMSVTQAAPVMRRCQVVTNPGLDESHATRSLDARCIEYVNGGIKEVPGKREVVGIGNGDHDLTATFHGATLPPTIQGRDAADGNIIGVGNDDSNTHLSLAGSNGDVHISASKRGSVGILNGASGDYNFDGATFGTIEGDQHVNKRDNVGVLNGATGDYNFNDATFGSIIGDQHVNKRGDGNVGVKNGATGGGDYSGTVWGPQEGDMYIGYSTTKRDGNNNADPCPGVPVGPSVGTTYMPTHPSTNSKRCSSTPIPPTDGGIVYTKRGDGNVGVKNGATGGGDYSGTVWGPQEGDIYIGYSTTKRDGNNNADPCPGVPVGPSVGTTYMPTHPSTNSKRCSSTPIPPTDGGIVYT